MMIFLNYFFLLHVSFYSHAFKAQRLDQNITGELLIKNNKVSTIYNHNM